MTLAQRLEEEVLGVPTRLQGERYCPECGHESVVVTSFYPATRVDPECSSGECRCRKRDEGCGCRYEWG